MGHTTNELNIRYLLSKGHSEVLLRKPDEALGRLHKLCSLEGTVFVGEDEGEHIAEFRVITETLSQEIGHVSLVFGQSGSSDWRT